MDKMSRAVKHRLSFPLVLGHEVLMAFSYHWLHTQCKQKTGK